MRIFEMHIRAREGAWATLRRRPRSRTVDIAMMIGGGTINRRVGIRDAAGITQAAGEMATRLGRGRGGDRATDARRYRDAIRLVAEG